MRKIGFASCASWSFRGLVFTIVHLHVTLEISWLVSQSITINAAG